MIKINKKIIIFVILSFIFSYYEGGYFPYALFYSFFVPFIISFIVLIFQYRNVFIEIKFDKDIISTKEEINITSIIRNYNILPISYVELKNKIIYSLDPIYKGDVFNIRLDENKRINKNIKFNYRGIYDFGDINLTFKDYLYIFTINKRIKKDFKVRVYPKIHRLNSLDFSGKEIINNIINKRGLIHEDYSISDVRKYRRGDSLKKIHWKLSAKHGELYVKKFDALQGEEYNIFLNMNKEDYFAEGGLDREEELIELCASIVNNNLNKNINSSIYIHNKESEKMYINSSEDFNNLMEYFVAHKSEGEGSFSKFLLENLKNIKAKGTIIICTPKISRFVKETILSISKWGYKIQVVFQGNTSSSIENANYLKANDIEVYNFNLRKDIYE